MGISSFDAVFITMNHLCRVDGTKRFHGNHFEKFEKKCS